VIAGRTARRIMELADKLRSGLICPRGTVHARHRHVSDGPGASTYPNGFMSAKSNWIPTPA